MHMPSSVHARALYTKRWGKDVCAHGLVHARTGVRASMHACMHACVCACVRARMRTNACVGQVWDLFTEGGSRGISNQRSLPAIKAHSRIAAVRPSAATGVLNLLDPKQPRSVRWLCLFVDVMNADERCASLITELVSFVSVMALWPYVVMA